MVNEIQELNYVSQYFYPTKNIVYVFLLDKMGVFIPHQKQLYKKVDKGGSYSTIKFILNVMKTTSSEVVLYNVISEKSKSLSHKGLLKEYKQNRAIKKEELFGEERQELEQEQEDFYRNLNILEEFIKIFEGIWQYITSEYAEGDFVIQYTKYVYDLLNLKINEKNKDIKFVYVIFSSDSDLYQLINQDVYLYDISKKKLITPFTIEYVYQKQREETNKDAIQKIDNIQQIKLNFDKTPEEILQKQLDCTKYVLWKKILTGDRSDNISGIKGFGEKKFQKSWEIIKDKVKHVMSEEEIETFLKDQMIDISKYQKVFDLTIIKRNYKLINLLDIQNVKNMLNYNVLKDTINIVKDYITQRRLTNNTNLSLFDKLNEFLKKYNFESLLTLTDFYLQKLPF